MKTTFHHEMKLSMLYTTFIFIVSTILSQFAKPIISINLTEIPHAATGQFETIMMYFRSH